MQTIYQRRFIIILNTAILKCFDRFTRASEGGVAGTYRASLCRSRVRGVSRRAHIREDTEMVDIQQFLAGAWLVLASIAVALGLVASLLAKSNHYYTTAIAVGAALPTAMYCIHGIIDGIRFKARPGDGWYSSHTTSNLALIPIWIGFSILLLALYD